MATPETNFDTCKMWSIMRKPAFHLKKMKDLFFTCKTKESPVIPNPSINKYMLVKSEVGCLLSDWFLQNKSQI